MLLSVFFEEVCEIFAHKTSSLNWFCGKTCKSAFLSSVVLNNFKRKSWRHKHWNEIRNTVSTESDLKLRLTETARVFVHICFLCFSNVGSEMDYRPVQGEPHLLPVYCWENVSSTTTNNRIENITERGLAVLSLNMYLFNILTSKV